MPTDLNRRWIVMPKGARGEGFDRPCPHQRLVDAWTEIKLLKKRVEELEEIKQSLQLQVDHLKLLFQYLRKRELKSLDKWPTLMYIYPDPDTGRED